MKRAYINIEHCLNLVAHETKTKMNLGIDECKLIEDLLSGKLSPQEVTELYGIPENLQLEWTKFGKRLQMGI